MWKPGYHTAVTLTLSNDNRAQPLLEVKSVLSETWATEALVKEQGLFSVFFDLGPFVTVPL